MQRLTRLLCIVLLLLGANAALAQVESTYHEFTALSAAGQTASFNTGFGNRYPLVHTVELTTTSSPATCTVQLEGCLPDPNVAGCWEVISNAENCTTVEMFHVINRPVRFVRLNLTALTGTAATVLAAAETLTDTGFPDTAATVLAPAETLSDTGFPDGTNWDEVGDFATPAGTAVYTHSGGTGTMTQPSGNLNTAGVASAHYAATYQVVSQSGDTACTITTAFAASSVDLDETVSTNTTFFTSAAVPGDFVISCTSTSGAITFDDFTITKQNCSNEAPINVTTTAAHGYTTGRLVTITGAVGNTACNVTDNAITVIDTTHFTIDGTTGNAKWTTGGAVTSDNWANVGDFALPAGTAVYTHSGGTGTLTQTQAQLNVAGVASSHYAATYQVVSQSGDTACTITTLFGLTAVDLDETVSTNTTFFTSAAAPTNFVISCTSTSGAITFDDFTITKQNCSNESPINVTTTAAHGYSTGHLVTITGAVGNTACNVADSAITVIDTTHFTIDGTTGNAKWTSGGAIVSDPTVTSQYLGVR